MTMKSGVTKLGTMVHLIFQELEPFSRGSQ